MSVRRSRCTICSSFSTTSSPRAPISVLHLCNRIPIDHVPCLLRQRHVERDDVAPVIEFLEGYIGQKVPVFLLFMGIAAKDPTAEALEFSCNAGADPSRSNDADRQVQELSSHPRTLTADPRSRARMASAEGSSLLLSIKTPVFFSISSKSSLHRIPLRLLLYACCLSRSVMTRVSWEK